TLRFAMSLNDRAPAFFTLIHSLSGMASMKKVGYVNVKIRRELASRLDEIAPRLGYEDRNEVVEDAVRRFMDAVEPRRE
ncbi:MAG: ribbon-helix-helix protein, CopG family, partial [Nitrososphaerota archaeon]|nr:ribbon-helix-helix protein, CopG family [Nitrososphaerota archaeon]